MSQLAWSSGRGRKTRSLLNNLHLGRDYHISQHHFLSTSHRCSPPPSIQLHCQQPIYHIENVSPRYNQHITTTTSSHSPPPHHRSPQLRLFTSLSLAHITHHIENPHIAISHNSSKPFFYNLSPRLPCLAKHLTQSTEHHICQHIEAAQFLHLLQYLFTSPLLSKTPRQATGMSHSDNLPASFSQCDQQ